MSDFNGYRLYDDGNPAMTKEEVIAGTLDWCNSQRKRKGIEPLTEMPKGYTTDPVSCPCGQATMMSVGNDSACDVSDGQEEPFQYQLPDEVRIFVREFDARHIPELIEAEDA